MKLITVAILSLLAAAAHAQSAPPTLYAESFRKGATQITEQKFEVKLTPENPTYREVVKDARGNDRYELTVSPQGPEGDTKITSWRVALRDLRHRIYSNILVAEQGPSADPKNSLWWLNPDSFNPVPLRATRIVKVDSFFVMFLVKDRHFTPLDSPYLDSMVVEFVLTNRDPRTAAQ